MRDSCATAPANRVCSDVCGDTFAGRPTGWNAVIVRNKKAAAPSDRGGRVSMRRAAPQGTRSEEGGSASGAPAHDFGPGRGGWGQPAHF